MGFLWGLLYFFVALWAFAKYRYKKVKTKVCLVGKTCLITGGNKGIGFGVSLNLASRGCRVIIACRSNAEEAKKEIVKITNNKNIEVRYLDLSSLDNTRKFAEDLKKTETKLDILINNAGLGSMTEDKPTTEDGLNVLMQTNFFGAFLLTHLLVDLLKKSEDPRVVFVSSKVAFLNDLTLDNLNPKYLKPPGTLLETIYVYGNSKLAQVIATRIFAEKLSPFGIKVNAVHPGGVRSNIFEGTYHLYSNFVLLFKVFERIYFKTLDEGAQPIIRIAISNTAKTQNGNFHWDLGKLPFPKLARNMNFNRKIWSLSEDLVKLRPEEKL